MKTILFYSKKIILSFIFVLICFQPINVIAVAGRLDNVRFTRDSFGEGLVREITDYGNGRYRVLFSSPNHQDKFSFEIVDAHSNVYQPVDFRSLSLNDGDYSVIAGSFSESSNYQSYRVRSISQEGGDTELLFEERMPEFKFSLGDSLEVDKKILSLINISDKPITIISVRGDSDNGNKLTILDLTEDKKIPVGGVYKIELHPGECFSDDVIYNLNIEFNTLAEGERSETNNIIAMTFTCKSGTWISSILHSVIDTFSDKAKVTTAIATFTTAVVLQKLTKFVENRYARRGGYRVL